MAVGYELALAIVEQNLLQDRPWNFDALGQATVQGALREVLAARAEGRSQGQLEGYALIPQSALDWLFGLGDSFERAPGQKGAFWWRTEFRRRIAASPLPPGVGWQPIETAPKDGTRIWGFFPFAWGRQREGCFAMSWRENVYEPGDPNWTLDDGESANLTYDPPSHWQPLPAPPDREVG